MYARRVSRAVLRRTRAPCRCRVPPLILHESNPRTQQYHSASSSSSPRPSDYRHADRRLLSNKSKSTSSGRNASKFPPPTEAASVPFPGKDLRVSRVGFGSPWMGAATDRGLDMSRYLTVVSSKIEIATAARPCHRRRRRV